MSAAEILKGNALFRDFTPVGLEIFAKIARPKVILAKKYLFSEGQPAQSLYFIEEGRFLIMTKMTDGTAVAVASLGAPEHLGEMALLAAGRNPMHISSAVAETNSKVLEITATDFHQLMKEKPQACTKLLLAASAEFGHKVADSRDILKQLLCRALAR